MPWRTPAAVALLAAVALCAAGRASGDHATVSPQAVAPWTGGDAVVTPLEALAGRIATRIAQHPVTVNCETASKFRALAGSRDVLGFVRALTDRSTGRYAETATVIELTSQVCGPLQRFADAAMKPTRCKAGNGRFVPCFTGTPVTSDSTAPSICEAGVPSCYAVVASSRSYWSAYAQYALAIQTLAHEAIHTFQAQAGKPVPQGDLVEQQADCYGMQWVPWVAYELGDTGRDTQAIADYFWLAEYPLKEHDEPSYWSADCRPGGALDLRPAGAPYWP
ncbi:MAG TPA: hypothetical protein VFB25_07435 [Gaiellaceae bacterium]|nr:hypothetical protein [Gaiellaceae bacterium]